MSRDPITTEENRRLHLEAQSRRDEEARIRREEEREAKRAAFAAKRAEELAARQAEEQAKRDVVRAANAADRDKRMRPKEPDIPTPPPAEIARFGTINNVLTPELRDALVNQRAQCLPPETAAARCRVPLDHFYGWVAQGRKDIAAGEATLFADFVLSMDQAGAEAEAILIGHTRGGDNWQSSKWLLEQSNPTAWGKAVQTVDVNVRSAHVIVAANVGELTDADVAEARKRIAEERERRRLAVTVEAEGSAPAPDGVHVAEEK